MAAPRDLWMTQTNVCLPQKPTSYKATITSSCYVCSDSNCYSWLVGNPYLDAFFHSWEFGNVHIRSWMPRNDVCCNTASHRTLCATARMPWAG